MNVIGGEKPTFTGLSSAIVQTSDCHRTRVHKYDLTPNGNQAGFTSTMAGMLVNIRRQVAVYRSKIEAAA